MNLWIKGLLNSIITGAATAGSSWMAVSAAKSAGFTAAELNFKTLMIILVAGSLTNAFSYLRQSPMFQSTTTTTTQTTTEEKK